MRHLFMSTALAILLALGTTGALLAQDSADDPAPVIEAPADDSVAPDIDSAAPDGIIETDPDATIDSGAITDGQAATDTEAAPDIDSAKVMREQAGNELRLKWITGATVTAPDGAVIGNISDLILDHDSNQLTAAVVGVGGFLGIGEKKIAVPWDRLTVDYDANQIVSDLTREEADAAPEYGFRDRESIPAPADPMGTAPADAGVEPAPSL